MIDLRSDTVTKPTPAMREAMSRAEVGDDVFGEDPTVNQLEQLAAARLGKEAGLLVSSGTMGNLVSLLTHTRRGDEVIVGDKSHIISAEVAGAACLGSVQLRPVRNDERGCLNEADVEETIRPENVHFPRTGLICFENTHNRCNGSALTPQEMAPVVHVARRHGIPIHIDGARIFNAAVALQLDVAELAREADSVQFCLSKGLAAPVGSVIVGGRNFIERARKYRKMVGGGMRQAGVLAAAGIIAIEEMVGRLREDHENARLLAQGLAAIPGISVRPEGVQTNIIFFQSTAVPLAQFIDRMREYDVLVGPGRIVTHYGIERAEIEQTLVAARKAMALPEVLGAR